MNLRFRGLVVPVVVAFVLGTAPLVACSDRSGDTGLRDSSSSGSSGSAKATGSDQEFVKGLCLAGQHFVDKMMKDLGGAGTTTATPASIDDFGNVFAAFFLNLAPAFAGLAQEFKALKPPKDLAQWHADAAAKLDAAAKALKAGKFDDPALNDLGNDAIPPLPQDVQDRLEKVSADIKECQDLDKLSSSAGGDTGMFGGLIGGGANSSAPAKTPTPKKK